MPEEYTAAFGDHLELQTYQQRLAFVKRKLGLVKQRALAQSAGAEGPVPMGVSNLNLQDQYKRRASELWIYAIDYEA